MSSNNPSNIKCNYLKAVTKTLSRFTPHLECGPGFLQIESEGKDEGARAFNSQWETDKASGGQLVFFLINHLSVVLSRTEIDCLLLDIELSHVPCSKPVILASWILQLHTPHDSEDRYGWSINLEVLMSIFLVRYW